MDAQAITARCKNIVVPCVGIHRGTSRGLQLVGSAPFAQRFSTPHEDVSLSLSLRLVSGIVPGASITVVPSMDSFSTHKPMPVINYEAPIKEHCCFTNLTTLSISPGHLGKIWSALLGTEIGLQLRCKVRAASFWELLQRENESLTKTGDLSLHGVTLERRKPTSSLFWSGMLMFCAAQESTRNPRPPKLYYITHEVFACFLWEIKVVWLCTSY